MKNFKLFILFLIVLVMIFSFGISASADSSRDSVEKLLLVMKQDQLMNQTFEQITLTKNSRNFTTNGGRN